MVEYNRKYPSIRHLKQLFLDSFDSLGRFNIFLSNTSQEPIPTNGDSVYVSDLDLDGCDNGDFSGLITDYFDDLSTSNCNVTSDNPKTMTIAFQRTIQTDVIGFGCQEDGKSFSNLVVKFYGSGDTLRYTKDLSADNTKYQSRLIKFPPLIANKIVLEFHTADEVCLSNIIAYKAVDTNSTLSGLSILTDEVENITTARGALNINPTSEFKLEVARGNIPGLSYDVLTAVSRAVPSSQITIGTQNVVYAFPGSAAQLSVVSSSALDTAGGTGAHTLLIIGLDSAYNPITELVTLNGTTPVLTTQSFLRVNPGGLVTSAGALLSNDGILTASIGANVLASILQHESRYKQMVYTVPAGFTAFNTNKNYSCGSGDEVEIIEVADFGNGVKVEFDNFFMYEDVINFVPQNMFGIPEKTDIDIRAVRSAGNSAKVSGFYEILIADNTLL